MHQKQIYMVTTELLLSQTYFIVAKTPEAAKEDADSFFEMCMGDLVSDTFCEQGTSVKCERIELWQLENVLECIEESNKLNSGITVE